MKEESKPLMFIDTINMINPTKNVEVKNVKSDKVYLNRLEDIRAMLFYKMNILIELKAKNTLYEGVVKKLNDNGLTLNISGKEITFSIDEIENINILKL